MIPVLFEDEFILAVNKPSGIPSQALTQSDENSAESRVKKEQGNPHLHLLHRLDQGTSGVLLFSKNENIYNEMREQFKVKTIEKNYLAFTRASDSRLQYLEDLNLPFEINLPLAHHSKSKKRMIPVPEGVFRVYRGKALPAQSFIEAFRKADFLGLEAIELKIRITTGVMHQIRVHLAHLGLSLIGDPLYQKDPDSLRLGLHSAHTRFTLQGRSYDIVAPLLLE